MALMMKHSFKLRTLIVFAKAPGIQIGEVTVQLKKITAILLEQGIH